MGVLGAKLSGYSEQLLTSFLLKLAPLIAPVIRFLLLSVCILWKQYELWASSSAYTTIMNSKSSRFFYAKQEEEQCSICLLEFRKGDSCCEIVDCEHVFHRKCLEKWLKGYRATCPLCRGVVVPEMIVAEHRMLEIERTKLTERLCRFSNPVEDSTLFFI